MSSTTSNSSVKPLQNQTQNWTGPTEPKSDIYSIKDFHFDSSNTCYFAILVIGVHSGATADILDGK